ncbi:MAG: DUF2183 domain-containing protein [Actinomycetota bacterium]|nr:DUF2183 domain-containing protein [Actinomycetota bacterium]
MAGIGQTALRLAALVDDRVGVARQAAKVRLGLLRPVEAVCYRGHGTAGRLWVRGRVLERQGIVGATGSDTVWQNLANMWRRFTSDEVRGARVVVRHDERTVRTVTDGEGFFDVSIVPGSGLPTGRPWHPVEVTVAGPLARYQSPPRTLGRVLVPPAQATLGVISDIDDTVVRTGLTSPLLMTASVVLLNNAHTRTPFGGVAAFYRALQQGPDGAGANPVFFVSSSPWNLYDLLVQFLDVHGIPAGPLFLTDWGIEERAFVTGGHGEHKLARIEGLLATYPGLPFVLVGDSGQQDPEVYQQVVREHPGRVAAIYIRDVTTPERDRQVHAIAADVRAMGVDVLLVADTVTAAEHAAGRGLIDPTALPGIREQRARDDAAR